MKKNIKKHFFTLIEMAVAMSIFAILMLIMMQLYGSIQSIWRQANNKLTTNEDARFVRKLIKDILQGIPSDSSTAKCLFYYQYDNADGGTGVSSNITLGSRTNPSLWFVSKTKIGTIPPNGFEDYYEVAFYLIESNESSTTTSKNNSIYNLYMATTTKHLALEEPNWDWKTNQNAYTTIISVDNSATTQLLLLENVTDFYVTPIPYTEIPPGTPTTKLPKRYRIVIELLANPDSAEKYMKADKDEKKNYVRTYSRVVERNEDSNGSGR